MIYIYVTSLLITFYGFRRACFWVPATRLALLCVVAQIAQIVIARNARLNRLSRLCGRTRQATIDQLLPVFLLLLKDDTPDVRLNIISKLDQVRG